MPHPEPEELALRALGETTLPVADEAHVAACPQCRAQVDALRATAARVRACTDGAAPPTPPPFDLDLLTARPVPVPAMRVWEAIRDELRLDPSVGPVVGTATGAGTPALPGSPPRPVPARTARRWRPPVALAASVALVAAGAAAALFWPRAAAPGPTTSARAELTTVPGAMPGASGLARLEQRGDARVLVVSAAGLASQDEPAGAFHEVWLIDPDTEALVSLGVLPGGADARDTVLPVPDALDTAEYDLVDVSAEPLDGDPAHSGDSLLRGVLQDV